jgi:hypothetical protein
VGLEWDPLSLVSTIEELLGRNSSGSGLEIREYSRGDPLCSPRNTLYPQKDGTNFADERWSLGRHNWLADQGHGVFLFTTLPSLNVNAPSCVKPSYCMVRACSYKIHTVCHSSSHCPVFFIANDIFISSMCSSKLNLTVNRYFPCPCRRVCSYN